jgi:DNA-binding HxlR family transcriptional regulator
MRSDDLADFECFIARPVSLLGDRWTLVVLRDAFLGVRRFEDFQTSLGISRSLLADRLSRLVEAGILRKEPYRDAIRTRDEYRLTEKGLDLYPVITALRTWGQRYMGEGVPELSFLHKGCGGETVQRTQCDCCGESLGARDVEVEPMAQHAGR